MFKNIAKGNSVKGIRTTLVQNTDLITQIKQFSLYHSCYFNHSSDKFMHTSSTVMFINADTSDDFNIQLTVNYKTLSHTKEEHRKKSKGIMLNIVHMGKLYNLLKEVFKSRTLLTGWISAGELQTSRAVPAFNSATAPNTIIFLETVLTKQKQNVTF